MPWSPLFAQSATKDDAAVEGIFEEWARGRKAATSVRYTVSGESLYAKDALAELGHVFPADVRHPMTASWLIDFEKNWFRVQFGANTYNLSTREFVRDDDIWGYDGEKLTCHRAAITKNRADYAPTQADFYNHKLSFPVLTWAKSPPIIAHGYVPKTFVSDDGNRQLIVPMTKDLMDVHGVADLDGERCVVLRTKLTARQRDFLEIWVPTTGLAVVRRVNFFTRLKEEEREVDVLCAFVTIAYSKRSDSPSLKGWRYTENHAKSRGGMKRVYNLKVETHELNPSVAVSDVRLVPTQGMVVIDEPMGTAHILGENGTRIPIAEVPLAASRGLWLKITLILSAVAVCGVFLRWLVRRRGRHAA